MRGERGRRPLRRILAVIAGAGLVLAGLTVVDATARRADAAGSTAAVSAMLQSFDPADIIDDAVMFNGSTMSVAAIQSFLNGKQPTCAAGATCLKSVTADVPAMGANPMCKAMSALKAAPVATIVYKVAHACDVNPQVILVMLQKEQTLVTGRMPYSGETVSLIYRKATGLGCPDTAACDPAKYGLFNQLYGVAYWLVRYTTPPGTTGSGWTSYDWFPVGRRTTVYYHPNFSCGGSTITIANAATASLYYYTPYQPNAASLSAGWGTGNSCSSYGNRNFYLYFTTWFGSTHFVVTGAIATAWKAAGGAKGALGSPTSNATSVTASGGGSSQRFQHGAIATSSAGTFVVSGSILTKWTGSGGAGGPLGWPRGASLTRSLDGGGTAQNFTKGTAYTSKHGTFLVTNPVRAEFGRDGYEKGALGWPSGDVVTSAVKGGATWQSFAGGRVVVANGVATTLTGAVLAKWVERGAEAGTLGWPTREVDAVTAGGTSGSAQTFQNGAVYVRGSTVLTVTGSAWKNYVAQHGPTGHLGWPTGGAAQSTENGGGWSQRFASGRIYWSSVGTHSFGAGAMLTYYEAHGGPTGSIGWLAGVQNVHGGSVGTFTGKHLYTSKAGTFAVSGAVLAAYLAKDAQAGKLGWPTGPAKTVGTKHVQSFQHGTITR